MRNMTVDRAYKTCRARSALDSMLDGFTKFGSTFGGGCSAGRLSIFSRASGDNGTPSIVRLPKAVAVEIFLKWRS